MCQFSRYVKQRAICRCRVEKQQVNERRDFEIARKMSTILASTRVWLPFTISDLKSRAPPMTTAVLLIAHGSRRTEANHDLVIVADQLKAQSNYSIIVPCYLEIAEPSIPDGARQCVESGADHVLMMPYFLSAGSHVTRDLERFRNKASAEFESVKFDLCPPLGLHPLMLQIVKDRLSESGDS